MKYGGTGDAGGVILVMRSKAVGCVGRDILIGVARGVILMMVFL